MKPSQLRLMIAILVSLRFSVSAATLYVDAGGTNPVVPYTSWATAATNIQDAVDASANGDLVLVTNGVYQYGGHIARSGDVTNRVTITNAITVQSVNGPAATLILGNKTNGPTAVRCAFLTNNAVLSGFTLTNGSDGFLQFPQGGGAYIMSSCLLSNCIVTGNAAALLGGGVYLSGTGGTVANCIVVGNISANNGGGISAGNNSSVINSVISGNDAANSGGGAYECILNNCVVSNNDAEYGGGVGNSTVNDCLLVGNGNTNNTEGGAAYFGTLNNCTIVQNFSHILSACDGSVLNNSIIYYNNNGSYADCYQCRLTNCCTSSLFNNGSPVNCITNPPLFANPAGDFHLLPWSPCIDAGTNVFAPSGTDLDGNPRIVGAAVDMGCYENQSTNPVHYVMLGNTAPVSPFTNWLTAATNIQDAIDASVAGDFVVVSNGVYNVGGRAVYGTATNRVVIDQAVTVQSLNGPAVTAIAGLSSPHIRCVYLTNGAALIGFTLTNGNVNTQGDPTNASSGGGVWCADVSATVSNCVLTANHAEEDGGGAYGGTLNNCIITNNQAFISGGGTYNSVLNNCLVVTNKLIQGSGGGGTAYGALSNCLLIWNSGPSGGGAYRSTLTGCVVSNNSAGNFGGGVAFGVACDTLISSNRASSGGGAYSNVLNNCILINNFANSLGGGAYGSSLANCTVVSNSTSTINGAGGGTYWCYLSNSIVFYNYSPKSPNYEIYQTAFPYYCCTTPFPGGFGNITNEPDFVNLAGEDFHLQSKSPCINSGNNSAVMGSTDFDCNPRIQGGTVDMGAYEFQNPSSTISYAYLQQYSLPTDGSVDGSDLDGTGFTVYQDWIAGLNPTNPASVLAMMPPPATNNVSGITITWQSVSSIIYFVQSATNLSAQPAFTTIASNIVGQVGTTSYTDTTATNNGPYFYRVGVQ